MVDKRTLCTADAVCKSFQSTSVLNQCNLSVAAAERVLLLGANGAGKSTLLRLIAGELLPTSGTLRCRQEHTGYLSQELQLYGALTVSENLSFFATIARNKAQPDAEGWGLSEVLNRPLSTLSKGMQQRVSLCRLFSEPYTFLLLDEPTSFLDATGVDYFLAALNEFVSVDSSRGFLMASHDIANVHESVNRAVVLQRGSVVLDSAAERQTMEAAFSLYQKVNR